MDNFIANLAKENKIDFNDKNLWNLEKEKSDNLGKLFLNIKKLFFGNNFMKKLLFAIPAFLCCILLAFLLELRILPFAIYFKLKQKQKDHIISKQMMELLKVSDCFRPLNGLTYN